jgi:hypothetical protein
LLYPFIAYRYVLEEKLTFRVGSIAMGEADAAFLDSVDWVCGESFQVDEILGDFADFVGEDEDCGADEA